MLLFLAVSLLLHEAVQTEAAELSRCCAGGSRHFSQTATCSGLRSTVAGKAAGMACSRSASICCLRALLDKECVEGSRIAKTDETCHANINVLGGGIKKECCDCCLLAKDLLRRNLPCSPPTGFSAVCIRSFNKCCATSLELSAADSAVAKDPATSKSSETAFLLGDRCSSAPCDHLCHDRGGDAVECSCRHGFELAPDGSTCLDIDECLLLMDDCLESQRCLNTPGSFKCIRILSCGTGYALDSDTEECIDVDECTLGSHDCGPLYACRNTQGSYRCDVKKCDDGELQNPLTGECTSIECPLGYEPSHGRCIDVNECLTDDRCQPGEECLNTPGGFRCQPQGSLCAAGFHINQNTGFCDDIDECAEPNACDGLPCTNLPGSFKCRCKPGFEFSDKTHRCEDVDECIKFSGHVCDALARCVNTLGSFACVCNDGFELGPDGRSCIDIDECLRGQAKCSQKCLNIPGSYQCICDRGYALSPDGIHCVDIDECSVWAGSGSDLCMGRCINTPGAYKCECPNGYVVQPDGRTCQDVDECASGECAGNDRICVNTLGAFKCHPITCPANYIHDKNYKNRCSRGPLACLGMADDECRKMQPVHITFQYIGIPRHVPISTHRPSITIFTIRGPSHRDSFVQFELLLNESIPESRSVLPAVRANFLLQKGEERNSAVVAMRDSLDGPQEVRLQLILRLTKHGAFHAKYLANLIIHVSHHKKQSQLFPNSLT